MVCGAHAFVAYKLVALLMGAKVVEVEMLALTHDLSLMRSGFEKTKLIFSPALTIPLNRQFEAEIGELYPLFCLPMLFSVLMKHTRNTSTLLPICVPSLRKAERHLLATFSKIHGLAALRVGYGYGSDEMIRLLQQARQPFNVNAVAQAAAVAALSDHDWVLNCRKRNRDGLQQLTNGLEQLGIEYIPSQANFILSKPGNGRSLF